MSIFERAVELGLARKQAVDWDGSGIGLADDFDTMLIFSGFDLESNEVWEYIDNAAGAFCIALSMGMSATDVFRGLIAEGLLTGLMVGRAQEEQAA